MAGGQCLGPVEGAQLVKIHVAVLIAAATILPVAIEAVLDVVKELHVRNGRHGTGRINSGLQKIAYRFHKEDCISV